MPIFTIIVILLMLGAVASLVIGVILMAKGSSKGSSVLENGRLQNKLMTYRIYFQAAAIVVIFLIFSITK